MRAPRRRGSSLEEAPLGAATPLRAPAAADHLSGPRPGLLCAPRNRRRRMVSPAHPLAACAFPCSAPRLPRKLQNLPKKSARKLSLASPNPSGVRAGERQFPPSPRARRRGLVALRAWRMATKDACFPPTSSERSVGAVEPHALERYCQALPAHGTPRMSQDQSRPNVLLIVTDQQRGDCLGIDGHPVLQTPAMDWLGHLGNFLPPRLLRVPLLHPGSTRADVGTSRPTRTAWSAS